MNNSPPFYLFLKLKENKDHRQGRSGPAPGPGEIGIVLTPGTGRRKRPPSPERPVRRGDPHPIDGDLRRTIEEGRLPGRRPPRRERVGTGRKRPPLRAGALQDGERGKEDDEALPPDSPATPARAGMLTFAAADRSPDSRSSYSRAFPGKFPPVASRFRPGYSGGAVPVLHRIPERRLFLLRKIVRIDRFCVNDYFLLDYSQFELDYIESKPLQVTMTEKAIKKSKAAPLFRVNGTRPPLGKGPSLPSEGHGGRLPNRSKIGKRRRGRGQKNRSRPRSGQRRSPTLLPRSAGPGPPGPNGRSPGRRPRSPGAGPGWCRRRNRSRRGRSLPWP